MHDLWSVMSLKMFIKDDYGGEDIFMAQLYFTKVLDKKLLVQETGR